MVKIQMSEIRTTKIDGVEFVTLTDYLRLKEEKEELEYLGDINEELKEENKKLKEEVKDLVERDVELNKKYMIVLTENKKLKYVIDSVVEKAGIEYIRLADGDVFMNPKNKLHISDTIQVDILNSKQ